ncbi:MAG: thiolase family protein [Spirochaetaceae bacterium]|nr:thiolase family protein [Spirochaetaceae bacterium]
MKKVFILDGLRSHIGKINGVYRNLLAEHLGAAVLKELKNRYPTLHVDQVIAGNAVGAGGNITRLMILNAGFSDDIPAITIDTQCSSGLSSIQIAEALIRSNACHCIIAGGFESSSTQPNRSYNTNDSRFQGKDTFYTCAQFSPQERSDTAMLDGAERVAHKWGITREELDYQALLSHKKAAASRAEMQDAIFPIEGSSKDESIREKIDMNFLSRMPVVSGTLTTAGNSCAINDGAAFVILCSEEYSKKIKHSPKAEILFSSMVAGDPLYSPVYAGKAAEAVLAQANLQSKEIACFEFNEAFAVINVLFARSYPNLTERYNPFGGALAYGHPYGASGAIILLHLMQSLRQSDYGICSIAAAGGQGNALLLRKL